MMKNVGKRETLRGFPSRGLFEKLILIKEKHPIESESVVATLYFLKTSLFRFLD
jgi:hypothetical protein